jgi:phosphoribosyl-AMP cyclohydrolase
LSDTARETGLVLDPKWDERGLIQAVATDAATAEVLMVAHMNAAALAATLATGEAHYWSRSRQEVWHKGATSGNTQTVVEIRIDCDQDAVWLRVTPAGPACHTGQRTCFYRVVATDGGLKVVSAGED